MSPRSVIRTAAGGVTRHRAQSVVIFMVLLVSTASATLGLALLANSAGPFDRAFASQRGADIAAAVNSPRATDAQLAATSRLPRVTGAAGPFPATVATVQLSLTRLPGAAGGLPPVVASADTVVGRASPGGRVDDLTVTEGHWAQRPGQIVLSGNVQPGVPTVNPALGSKVTVSTAPGRPALTVVGYAKSITDTAGAWVVPAQVAALRPAGAPATAQMLYRFASAASAAQLRADGAAVAAALPAGAIAGTASWLAVRAQATGASSIIAPFVVAFALIGLVTSVLIVANVVSGAVVAGYRRIGLLKSIGFTPAQVVMVYLARIGRPALPGCLAGVVLGNVLAVPVLRKSATIYAIGGQSVPAWVTVAAPLVMVVLVGLAALAPAVRAGRLSAIQAIATGQAPSQGRGYAAHRFSSKLRLPRPVSIGLAAPFARPGRTLVTFAAITMGAIAVIFAVGLDLSLAQTANGLTRASTEPVQVVDNNPVPPTPGQEQVVVAKIRSQQGTLRWVTEAAPMISVSGLTQPVPADAFDGSAQWTGYDTISGHWYRRDGEVDVNTAFLNQTGLAVGDLVHLTVGGKAVTARIAGQVFDPQGRDQPTLLASWQTLGGAAAGLTVTQYDIGLKPGVSAMAYATALGQSLPAQSPFGMRAPRNGQFFAIATSLIALLTLMIAAVAGLGVLNTVLISTRERVHDLGIFKAVGMMPRQVIAMVVCWVAGPALAAAVIAVPAAIALHSATLRQMGAAGYTGLPAVVMNVYRPAELALLGLSALAIAALGALLPASWAARAPTMTALRTE